MDHFPIIRQVLGPNRTDRRPVEIDPAGNVYGRARDLGILPFTYDHGSAVELWDLPSSGEGIYLFSAGGVPVIDRTEGLWGLGVQERPPVDADVILDETEFVFCETTITYGSDGDSSGVFMRVFDTEGTELNVDPDSSIRSPGFFNQVGGLGATIAGTNVFRTTGTHVRQPFNFQLPTWALWRSPTSSNPIGRVEFSQPIGLLDGQGEYTPEQRTYVFNDVRTASSVRGWVDRPNNNFRSFSGTQNAGGELAIPFLSGDYYGPVGWLLGVWPVPYEEAYRLRIRASGTMRGSKGWRIVFSTNHITRQDGNGDIPSSFQTVELGSNQANAPFVNWTFDEEVDVGPLVRPDNFQNRPRFATYIMVQLVGDSPAENRIDCDIESIEFISPNYPQVYGA